MTKQEVIGFLAGSWDAGSRTINITHALPGDSAVSFDGTVTCEMDPVSQVALREQAEKEGLQDEKGEQREQERKRRQGDVKREEWRSTREKREDKGEKKEHTTREK